MMYLLLVGDLSLHLLVVHRPLPILVLLTIADFQFHEQCCQTRVCAKPVKKSVGFDTLNDVPVIESLEPRMMYSADPLGVGTFLLVTTETDVMDAVIDSDDANAIASLLRDPGADGFISLREAVLAANANCGADTIFLESTIYELIITSGADSGALQVTDELTVVGQSPADTIIRTMLTDRLFSAADSNLSLVNIRLENSNAGSFDGGGVHIRNGVLSLSHVEIESSNQYINGGAVYVHGDATLKAADTIFENNNAQNGGAIFNLGTAELDRVVLKNNTAYQGGGIYNEGNLSLLDVEVEANKTVTNPDGSVDSTRAGGGIFNLGNIDIERALFYLNESIGKGGALSTGGIQTVAINNAFFVENQAAIRGGAINTFSGNTDISHSTFSQNSATAGFGGALDAEGGSTFFSNSVFSGNIGSGAHQDVTGSVQSLGFNLLEMAGTTMVAQLSDNVVIDAKVASGSLTNHGGFIRGVALLAGSDAINAAAFDSESGNDATHTAYNEFPDIGAFEYRGTDSGDKIYWSDLSDKSIYRANADGSGEQIIYTSSSASQPFDVEIDLASGKIYWVEAEADQYRFDTGGGFGVLMRADLDGNSPEVLASGLLYPTGLALDLAHNRIFVTSDATGENAGAVNAILEFDSDGVLNPTPVFSGLWNSTPATASMIAPTDIHYDVSQNALIWTDRGNNFIANHIKVHHLDTGLTEHLVAPGASGYGYFSLDQTEDGAETFIATNYTTMRLTDIVTNPSPPVIVGDAPLDDDEPVIGMALSSDEGKIYVSFEKDGNGVIASLDTDLTIASQQLVLESLGQPGAIDVVGISAPVSQPIYSGKFLAQTEEGGQIDLSVGWQSSGPVPSSQLVYNIVEAPNYGTLVLDSAYVEITQQAIDAGAVSYQHNGNEEHIDTMKFTVSDGSSTTEEVVFTIIALPINDEPYITDVTLGSIVEDSNLHSGSIVADLFGPVFNDPDDGGFPFGIAVVENPLIAIGSDGEWQYRVDGGSWQAIGVVAQDSALVLGLTTHLRFLPASDFNGVVDPLRVRAIDNSYTGLVTTNIARQTTDTIPNGNTAAFSINISSVTTSVTSQNDAPTITDGGISQNEDAAPSVGQTISALFSKNFSDIDSDTLAGILVTGDQSTAAQGLWQYSTGAGAWFDIGGVGESTALVLDTNTLIRFEPAEHFNGTPGSLQVRAIDSSYAGVYTVDGTRISDDVTTGDVTSYFSQLDRQLTTTIAAVNDAPTISDGGINQNEDAAPSVGQTISALFSVNFSDIDSDTLAGILVTGDQSTAAQGLWQYSTGAGSWFDIGTVADATALVLDVNTLIRFEPAEHFNGTPGSLQVRAIDSSYAGVYTVDGTRISDDVTTGDVTSYFSQLDRQLTTTIAAVNDAPTISDGGINQNEDAAPSVGQTISALFSVNFNDIDSDTLAGILVTGDQSTAAQGLWQYSTGAGAWFDIGTVADATALVLDTNTLIRFVPAEHFNGTPGSLQIRAIDSSYAGVYTVDGTRVDDDVATGDVTSYFSQLDRQLTTTIAAVNDAPTISDGGINQNEDAAPSVGQTISALFSTNFSDIDSDTLAGILVTGDQSTAAQGLWQYSTGAGSWFDIGTVADATALVLDTNTLIRFVPAEHFNGTPGSLQVRAIDSSYAGVYTVDGARISDDVTTGDVTSYFSQLDNQLYTNVSAINDSPIIVDASLSQDEDALSPSGVTVESLFSANFTDTDLGEILSGVAITANHAAMTQGQWQYSTGSGLWFEVGAVTDAVALVLKADSLIRFLPAEHYNGTPEPLLVKAIDSSYMGLYSVDDARELHDISLVDSTSSFSMSESQLDAHIRAVNDAPTINDSILDQDEDTPLPPGNRVDSLFSESFADSDNGETLAGIMVTLNQATVVQGVWQYNTGSGTWFDIGAVSPASALVLQFDTLLRFVPVLDYNGTPAALSVRAIDSSYTGLYTIDGSQVLGNVVTGSSTSYFSEHDKLLQANIVAINDAPTIINSDLSAQIEDGTPSTGESLESLFSTGFSDTDVGEVLAGIVITNNPATTAQGAWQYSSNAGAWLDVGEVTPAEALTLSASTLVRFVPEPDYHGTPGALSVRAIDSSYTGAFTDHGIRLLSDVSSANNTSAFSIADGLLSVEVLAVNDRPVAQSVQLAVIDEDEQSPAGHTIGTLYSGNFSDLDSGSSLGGLAIVGNPLNGAEGQWQYSEDGLAWHEVGAVSEVNALLLSKDWSLRFLPAENYNGTPQGLDALVIDNTYNGVMGEFVNESVITNSDAFSLTTVKVNQAAVTAVPDAPNSLTLDNVVLRENDLAAVIGEFTITDVDPLDTHMIEVDDPRFEVVAGELRLRADETINYEEDDTIPLLLSITDSAGLVYQHSINLIIQDVNEAPEIVGELIPQTVSEPFTFSIPSGTFTDVDGDNLTYAASLPNNQPLPSWVQFNPQTLQFFIDPEGSAAGEVIIVISADDGRGAFVTTELLITLALEPDTASATSDEKPVIVEEQPVAGVQAITPAKNLMSLLSGEETALVEVVDSLPQDQSVPVAVTDSVSSIEVEQPINRSLVSIVGEEASGGRNEALEKEPDVMPEVLNADTMPMEFLFDFESEDLINSFASLADIMDEQRTSDSEDQRFAVRVVGTSVTVSSGLSVGYVLWLVRGGTLIGSVLSTLPAWRFIDPLPILESLADETEGDDESLESMVSESTESAYSDSIDQTDTSSGGDSPESGIDKNSK